MSAFSFVFGRSQNVSFGGGFDLAEDEKHNFGWSLIFLEAIATIAPIDSLLVISHIPLQSKISNTILPASALDVKANSVD